MPPGERTRAVLSASAVALLAGACSSNEPVVLLDAGGDAPAARCLIPADYGAIGTKVGTANNVNGNPTLTIVLEDGAAKDDFFIRLVDGKGVFAGGGLATGTYAIQGIDKSFTDCGLCTNILADIVAGQGPTKFYYTDAGMVTLTSTNPIAGSAQNLHFVEIDINTGMPLQGGCTTSVTSITFGS